MEYNFMTFSLSEWFTKSYAQNKLSTESSRTELRDIIRQTGLRQGWAGARSDRAICVTLTVAGIHPRTNTSENKIQLGTF